jgi:hypothetical protein
MTLTASEYIKPVTPSTKVLTLRVDGATVYTNTSEAVQLSDYAIALDANGKLMFASRLEGGYGGPADGFYHDGSYAVVSGQQCGIFNLDPEFAGWPNTTADGRNAWTLYTVVVPEGWKIITGTWEQMSQIMISIDAYAVNDGNYFERIEDGKFNEISFVTIDGSLTDGCDIAKYTSDKTSNMKDGENNAELINLDSSKWVVTASRVGSQMNNVGLNKAGQIRFYANANGEGYSEVTFSCVDMIEYIVIELGIGKNQYSLGVYVDGVKIEANKDGTFTINSNSFVIFNDSYSSTSSQLWITSISMKTN